MTLWNYIVEFEVDRLCAEVHVNGWPVCHNHSRRGRATNVKVSPWLLEGDNVIQIYVGPPNPDEEELDPPERDPSGLVTYENVNVSLFKVPDEEKPRDHAPLLFFRWLEACHPLPDDGLALVYEHRFTMEEAFGPYRWTQAQPYAETDRPAIVALVRELHGAVERQDFDALIRLLKVKLEELGPCAGLDYDGMVEEQRRFLGEIFEHPIAVQPLDPDELHLRVGSSGRLVQVERPAGDQRAIKFNSPTLKMGASLPICVSNLDGVWTLVR